jgi:aldehyde:ferredoxin oxidoreductase
VVGKSPKTGGWGDANCGGKWGPALKQAGLDAVFLVGVAGKPTLAVVEKGAVRLADASGYWGLDCVETEERLAKEFGRSAHSAVIGPAGERASNLACIVTDGGRVAGRSGLGAVMGAKRLKAVVALAADDVEVAHPNELKALRKSLLEQLYNDNHPVYAVYHNYGTPAFLAPCVASGDAPIKNWGGTAADFPGAEKISVAPVVGLRVKKYACWHCPIACGATVRVAEGPYAGEGHQPEYETLAAFGSLCLNDDLEAICRVNELCNRAGLDTISTGATVAFAIECFENGVLTEKDTGGLRLTWGSHEAIVALTGQIASGQGFGGRVLADGLAKALDRLGPALAPYAMECGGEELPMHDPRCLPGYGTSYVVDATPARHTQMGSVYPELGFVPMGLPCPPVADKYGYRVKGQAHKVLSAYGHVVNATGLCQFASTITPATAIPDYLSFSTGRTFSLEGVLLAGERIANLRIAFNLREGVRNGEAYKLPKRVLGQPPLPAGATQGITVDNEAQARDYYAAMGWNVGTGVPSKAVFRALGLDFALDVAE